MDSDLSYNLIVLPIHNMYVYVKFPATVSRNRERNRNVLAEINYSSFILNFPCIFIHSILFLSSVQSLLPCLSFMPVLISKLQ